MNWHWLGHDFGPWKIQQENWTRINPKTGTTLPYIKTIQVRTCKDQACNYTEREILSGDENNP